VQAVVAYNYSDEATDYEHAIQAGDIDEGEETSHIFLVLKRLDAFLGEPTE
jgi:hypothetical protein